MGVWASACRGCAPFHGNAGARSTMGRGRRSGDLCRKACFERHFPGHVARHFLLHGSRQAGMRLQHSGLLQSRAGSTWKASRLLQSIMLHNSPLQTHFVACSGAIIVLLLPEEQRNNAAIVVAGVWMAVKLKVRGALPALLGAVMHSSQEGRRPTHNIVSEQVMLEGFRACETGHGFQGL